LTDIFAAQVYLATQVLSNSVADAIMTCRELGLPAFDDCDATVIFIKVIDNSCKPDFI
jgi:hypothetical protein